MVFAGLFPTDSDDYPELRDALERLKLNDAALFYEPETSQALGFGFRCGFLGLLHMEIVRERLEREFDLDLLVTAPNVAYRVRALNDSEWVEVHTPSDLPDAFEEVEEPYIKASIIVPKEFVGAVMELNNDRRGRFDHMEYLSPERVHLTYELPLAEIVLDYYDQLKSRTRGYASFDYDVTGFQPGNLARVDILVGGEPVDALSLIIHRDFAYDRGRQLVEKLREEIPRQMFDVAIQAAIGARVIARETVKAPPQGRAREVLRRRHLAQAQAAREAEGGQEADEAGRRRRGAAGGVPRGAQPERHGEEVAMALELRGVCERCDAALGRRRRRRRSAPSSAPSAPRARPMRRACLPELRRRARRRGRAATAVTGARAPLRPPAVLLRRAAATATSSPSSAATASTARYVDALLARARARTRRCSRAPLETIYLGGGTPTLHRARGARAAARGAAAARRGDGRGEPRDGDARAGGLLRRAGVDRVSLGAQTLRATICCGRSIALPRPTTSGARSTLLRDAGFDNISLDLIYGIPGQSAADLERDLAEALALEPEHVSAYELEAKPGTRFTHAHGAELERQAESMESYFELVVETLTAAGYRWYETANFCRVRADGRDLRARHNLGYWLGHDYLGLGVGAVSTIENRRWRNAPRSRATSPRSAAASGRRASSRSCRPTSAQTSA